jgi:predicted enzyme related to lactoylglutathione lyase
VGAPVVHFEVIGRDFEAMRRFYGELFDWELNPAGPADYAIVGPQDGQGIGGGVGGAGDRAYGVTFYAQVTDLATALGRAEELGGERAMEPTQVAEGTWAAQFRDPEGHLIGLVQS